MVTVNSCGLTNGEYSRGYFPTTAKEIVAFVIGDKPVNVRMFKELKVDDHTTAVGATATALALEDTADTIRFPVPGSGKGASSATETLSFTKMAEGTALCGSMLT
jgi:hypothetical protein